MSSMQTEDSELISFAVPQEGACGGQGVGGCSVCAPSRAGKH